MYTVSKLIVKTDLKDTISKSIEPLGGLSNFINKNDKVLLKANFNTSDPYPASSDLEFLKSVIELLYDHAAEQVFLGGSSTFSRRTQSEMEKLGVFELEKMNPAPTIINFDKHKWIKKKINYGRYLKSVSTPEILDQVDKLILLPCLKTHFLAQYTGALKLSVGFMKPRERLLMHSRKLQEKIAELNTLINPDLAIMDARKCFITKGPHDGELREPNLILSSKSRVNIDIEGVKIIQNFEGNDISNIKPEEIPQIKFSKQIGIK